MIKVVGFWKRHPNLTHEEYAAAHAGLHVSLGRRMRNLAGYLHYSWVDAGFSAAVPGAGRHEPDDFYDLWDGFSELYFANFDDYSRATRAWARAEGDQVQIAERAQGEFSRQLFLGEGLDRDHISAAFENGVLTLTIPVAEEAKPRKVEITHAEVVAQAVTAGSVAE